jgi:isoquinoline 1-oxidoreductase beta subunit
MSDPPVRVLRRSFLAGLGLAAGGFALGAFEGDAFADDRKIPQVDIKPSDPATAAKTAAKGAGLRPNVFVHIGADDVVTIVCARSEMGQGVRSSLPVLVADEMGADLVRVKVAQGDGDKAYGDQNTDGSHSVRGMFEDLRRVGAAARIMLVAAAAKRWKVAVASCTAHDGAVFHDATQRTLRFGELADEAGAQPTPKKEDIKLRPLSELKHLGTELPLLDGPDIVAGRAVFGADVKLQGMLTAVVARPPVVGGKVLRHDPAKALAVNGVKRVIVLPEAKRPFAFKPVGGVAVVADNTWAAMRGRAALDITWEPGDNATYDSRAYREGLLTAVKSPGKTARSLGDVDAALAGAKTRVEAVYYAPHLAHASMEPPVAIARVDGNGCEVWTSTQNPQAAKTEVAKALGLDESQVTIHVTLLGGGFGRKSKPDYVVEAALVSKEMGAPVRLQWTREDDIQHDYYHSVSAQRLVAGLDDAGKVVAWRHRIAFPTISSTFTDAKEPSENELQQGVLDTPLAVPNVRAEGCEAIAHTRIGWLRSVANVYHAFAIQSFVDELAHARGVDPLAMQREILGPARIWKPADLGVPKLPNYGQSLDEHPVDTARHHRVLDRVTELSKWSDRNTAGRSLGLAVHRSFLSYVAVVISVVKGKGEKIAVDEAWIVADAGTIVNLERVRSQLEGAVLFGLSHALYGEISMKDGATEQSNFRDYRLMRIAEAPRKVHVEVVKSEGPPGGIGEPGVPPVAPALANALFALTGQRVRDLPIVRSLSV